MSRYELFFLLSQLEKRQIQLVQCTDVPHKSDKSEQGIVFRGWLRAVLLRYSLGLMNCSYDMIRKVTHWNLYETSSDLPGQNNNVVQEARRPVFVSHGKPQ